jgi:hypothetical protein
MAGNITEEGRIKKEENDQSKRTRASFLAGFAFLAVLHILVEQGWGEEVPQDSR